MEVLNKPESQSESEQPQPGAARKRRGLLYGGRESKLGFFAGRFAFVVVGTMFVVMVIFSLFMLWVTMNEPYLQPYVINDKLYQDKVYLQVDGESTYRELIIATQPGDYDQKEITQIPYGKSFKVIFTPKQLEVPENYYITFQSGPNQNQEIATGYTRQAKYLRDSGFYSLEVYPREGAWPEGQYVIDAPSGGMFGGRNYAYFTVSSPSN
ncbi:MAG TPA: hypothetical protein VH186_24220 [Chloroflexia bacterium]|nr:hypothetical protein [Chloroflexia bacterium]